MAELLPLGERVPSPDALAELSRKLDLLVLSWAMAARVVALNRAVNIGELTASAACPPMLGVSPPAFFAQSTFVTA